MDIDARTSQLRKGVAMTPTTLHVLRCAAMPFDCVPSTSEATAREAITELLAEGLIVATNDDGDQTIYAITPPGRDVLAEHDTHSRIHTDGKHNSLHKLGQ